MRKVKNVVALVMLNSFVEHKFRLLIARCCIEAESLFVGLT